MLRNQAAYSEQGAVVREPVPLVDAVGVEVSSQGSEGQVASLGVSARSGNVIDVGEDGIEEGSE